MRRNRELRLGDVSEAAVPARNANAGVVALIMTSMAVPSSLTFYIGDSKFYAARLMVSILFIPALLQMFGKGRRFVACDAFALLVGAWMVAAPIIGGRYESLSSAQALVVEFLGGYFVARGFILGRAAVEGFVKALKVLVAIAVAAAMLDHISGRLLLNSLIGPIIGMHLAWEPEYRGSLLRAMSIFPHPILYGAFCTVSGALFIYARQWTFVGVSILGCVLAMSSAPLLVFGIVIAVYCYDALLHRYAWRWRAFTAMVACFFAYIWIVTEHPLSWIIANLTFDPATGYFRMGTWDRAFYNIGLSPLTGYGFDEIGFSVEKDVFDIATVDAVWLVMPLRFGIPIIPLLLLANISAYFGGAGKRGRQPPRDDDMQNLGTGFTLAIWVFMLVGLTVHFWNAMWLLWGVILGIRAGFKEDAAAARTNAGAYVTGGMSPLAAGDLAAE
ncbi:hypothetical protein [Rhodoblastus sphagnicola]|uniref:hypothetical protein n=1 Tax=Rhodoblastus sphagnicola TaxID=333368 RepID=UPI0019D4706F|nr:hypothetical protein [Rhodoblastus sphagnicola]